MDQKPDETKAAPQTPDFEELSRNMARFVEEAGKATAAYMKPLEENRGNTKAADDAGEIVRTLGRVAETWMSDPGKAMEAQGRLGAAFLDLWASTFRKMQGEPCSWRING